MIYLRVMGLRAQALVDKALKNNSLPVTKQNKQSGFISATCHSRNVTKSVPPSPQQIAHVCALQNGQLLSGIYTTFILVQNQSKVRLMLPGKVHVKVYVYCIYCNKHFLLNCFHLAIAIKNLLLRGKCKI